MNVNQFDFLSLDSIRKFDGLVHEHSRVDRNNFIIVDTDNIIEDELHNFSIYNNSISIGNFDFNSIMLYPCYSGFALDSSKPVITKLDGSVYNVQRNYPSAGDIAIVNFLYNLSGTFTDPRDGQIYAWVKIGSQVWMAENLAYNAGSGCWAYKVQLIGRLYDWPTALISCPDGWHLPSHSDWIELEMYLENPTYIQDFKYTLNVANKLKSKTGWEKYGEGLGFENNGNGTDDYNFNARPEAHRTNDGDIFDGGSIWFWTSTLNEDNQLERIFVRALDIEPKILLRDRWKELGIHVRCIKD